MRSQSFNQKIRIFWNEGYGIKLFKLYLSAIGKKGKG
jgi:hypothetical protein